MLKKAMDLQYQEYDDFFVFSKPFGVRTHKVAEGQYGFVEYLAEKMSRSLFVVHRLDKETSGLILFAKSKESAAALSALFENHQIKKTYYFLTDRRHSEKQITVASHIEKQSEFFVNNENLPPNSETQLEFIEQRGQHFLWKALPVTGKPHQIRLHAQKAGIPILGDDQHAGSRHYRLALHATQLEFSYAGKNFKPKSECEIFQGLFDDSWGARHALFKIEASQCYRLLHQEHPYIRADIYGDRLWVYDYSNDGLTNEELAHIQNFADRKKLILIVRHMLNRGTGVGGLEKETLTATDGSNWVAEENSIKFQLKTDSGFSPGLFLDQRENRKWVRENSRNKNVLNLFSYTAGLSLNAALGGASQVTTVDVSKKFLDWAVENFELNKLNSKNFEFFSQDTLLFLKGSIKRNRKWDLIICDPPSFGRSKDGVWKLEQNLPELAELMFSCLNKNGKILFTCNLEKRTRKEIIDLFSKSLRRDRLMIERMPMMGLDFEVTDDLHNVMKGFIVSLKS